MAQATRRRIFPQKEGQPKVYETDLVDRDGNAVAGSALLTLTLTYYVAEDDDEGTANIINNRNQEDMLLSGSGCTVNASGHLTWVQEPADAEMRDEGRDYELHVGLFEFTFGSNPVKSGEHEFGFRVENTRRK